MITRKHMLAVSVLLTIVIATTTTAGAFDLFGLFKSAEAETPDQSCSSLDCMLASISNGTVEDKGEQLVMNETTLTPANSPLGGNGYVLRRTYTVQVSGYNSEVAQTDASPWIGSAGTFMRDGVVAANIINAYGGNIPHFTKIKFKDCGSIPNDKIFSVEDRLNKRYRQNVDVWFASKADALKLGRRTCQIEVLL